MPFILRAPPNTLPVSDFNLLGLLAVDILLDKIILKLIIFPYLMVDEKLVEQTILNLKMMSQIKPFDKLYLEDELLKIDTPTLLQGVYRWYKEYSRNNTTDDLDIIVNQVIKITDILLTKNDISNEENALCQQILIEINNACKGLSNLKITYNDDLFIASKLDIIKDKLKARKDKIISIMKVSFS